MAQNKGQCPQGPLSPQASPPELCPHGRTRDLDALLAVMRAARQFIYVSVMDYFPTTRFTHPARSGWGSRWPWRVGPALLTETSGHRPGGPGP